VTELLCKEWSHMGHHVTIVTHTEGSDEWEGLKVYRRPAFFQQLHLTRQHDVVWQSNISLRYVLPLLFAPKPWFTTAHLWPFLATSRWTMSGFLKHFVQLFTRNIYVSKTVAMHHLWPGIVMPNPVDIDRWRPPNVIARNLDIVFVGRLVEGKGCMLLIKALLILSESGIKPKTSIIGGGPQLPELEKIVNSHGLQNTISFTGPLQGEALVKQVLRHRLSVIPSIWEEPFGVVVLEQIAAGCVPLFSPMGGLPEAAGSCGVQIYRLTPHCIAETISSALLNYERLKASLDIYAPSHLKRHSVRRIASSYVDLFNKTIV
jgi:glycogen(starch) synthase